MNTDRRATSITHADVKYDYCMEGLIFLIVAYVVVINVAFTPILVTVLRRH